MTDTKLDDNITLKKLSRILELMQEFNITKLTRSENGQLIIERSQPMPTQPTASKKPTRPLDNLFTNEDE